tara:strand:+ start:8149 stop:8634 length:486 start_codon:yes stop_codon:yes gene_type:complete
MIGITFPGWTDETLGGSVAFISKEENKLACLSAMQYFKIMQEQGFITVSEIRQVPPDVYEVKFVRNQSIVKFFPGEARRRLIRGQKRAFERGEPFVPISPQMSRVANQCHIIPMDSLSSGQRFPLFIQRCSAERTDARYNSYGFATTQTHMGTVPYLRQIT